MQSKMQQLRATWYCQKSWPEMVPEAVRAITESWPEVAPEVMTGSGTRNHDREGHQKSWPEVAPEVMTRSGTGSHDQKCHRKSWPEVTYRQTETECVKIGSIPCIADVSSNISSPGLSSRNCFDTGRTRNPEPRSQDKEINKESALS